MPKYVSEIDLERIKRVVATFPNGAPIEEIIKLSPTVLPKRTMQRWLKSLVASGRLIRKGKGKSVRYFYSSTQDKNILSKDVSFLAEDSGNEMSNQIQKKINTTTQKGDYMISPVGLEIKEYIKQPIEKRKIVGYNRNFLDMYIPNKTSYLTEDICRQLLAIGEVSKEVQPAGTYARQILNRFLIDLSWNSSRLEGNTYSLLDTENLIMNGEIAGGKQAFEAQMIINHKAAINFLVNNIDLISFNSYTILNLHALLSDNLLGNPASCGRLRTIPVRISKTLYHPLETPQLIEECFNQILATASAIVDPFEQAFFVMVHIPYLQPFDDVNKRVARLAANIPFIKYNLCPLSFIGVSVQDYIDGVLGIYECNRIDLLRDIFIWAYQRSVERYSVVRSMIGEPDIFRLKYYRQIKEIVSEVVKKRLNKTEAAKYIRHWVENSINEADRFHFIATVETELLALREGNIARFDIYPDEFNIWQMKWS